MARVLWTDPALDDLELIQAYIRQFSPLAAARYAQRLRSAAESLSQYPERGRSIIHGRRELAIVPPYLIRYRVEPDAVVILRIRHGA